MSNQSIRSQIEDTQQERSNQHLSNSHHTVLCYNLSPQWLFHSHSVKGEYKGRIYKIPITLFTVFVCDSRPQIGSKRLTSSWCGDTALPCPRSLWALGVRSPACPPRWRLYPLGRSSSSWCDPEEDQSHTNPSSLVKSYFANFIYIESCNRTFIHQDVAVISLVPKSILQINFWDVMLRTH